MREVGFLLIKLKEGTARNFPYMIDTWGMPIINSDKDMYIKWSISDPVTQAENEINRRVCEVQGNSNNFVEVLIFDPISRKCESIN